MPELPEVETVRRGLAEHVVGSKFKEITVLHRRATSPKSIAALTSLKGARVTEVARRGKFLWFKLDRPEVLVGHLGMSGQFLIQPKNAPDERHLRVKISLGKHDLRFIDQRTFGWLGVDAGEYGGSKSHRPCDGRGLADHPLRRVSGQCAVRSHAHKAGGLYGS